MLMNFYFFGDEFRKILLKRIKIHTTLKLARSKIKQIDT